MATMTNVYLGGTEPYAYHRICMRHLASNFMNRFKDKTLKNLVCKAALANEVGKFNKHIDTIEWHRPEQVLRHFNLHQGIPLSYSLDQ